VEHPDPEKVVLALKLQERYPPDPEAPGGVYGVLRSGRPEFFPEITGEMLEAAALDEEHLELLRQMGFTSAIVVPMIARGRTLGAITLVSAESGRKYDEADLDLANELALRAALAVDNTRLYEEAQTEIAEREWAQAELRSSRDELRVILEGVADGVTAQNPTGRIIYANEAAARMIGYPSGQALVEAPLGEVMERFEVLDEEGSPFPLEKLPGRRALGGEEGTDEVLCFRVLATGEERWSIVRATPVLDDRGKVRMAVNIFRDITERRRTEETLQEIRDSERRRIARDLHDGVLQDLSYTAAAIGLIMLEVEGTRLEEELQSTIDAVRRAAQGLRDAVNDLRLEEERDRPFPELVESLVRRNRVRTPGCEITLEVEEGFPSTPLGETGTQVSRVVQEAITNARRHSGAQRVSVTLKLEGEDLVAEISDDGRGFGPETTPGVGLSSMRERAAIVGGKLVIESEAGRGTRVSLRAPVPQKG
jgi:PAS domain S-box-containing protein